LWLVEKIGFRSPSQARDEFNEEFNFKKAA
jgi:hypothetical protein